MVSTRSVKYKFSEGEKVLCYEPDPAKTKVLYNSKVLDVVTRKDETGRKVAHFLIHFQGWNSTWDRFVTEDFILKDTEENRKLQRELAEKAQLTASCGNLYRRERKKRSGARSRAASSSSTGVCSIVNEPLQAEVKLEVVPEEDPSDSEMVSTPVTRPIKTLFTVSPTLRSWLETDMSLIKYHNKLVRVPAEPSAVDVLQSWMIEFSVSQIRLMCHKRGHLRPSAGKKANTPTPDSIYKAANLCREVSDGLRVYMDSMLFNILLYDEERLQFSSVVTLDPLSNYQQVQADIKVEMEEEEPAEDVAGAEGEVSATRRRTLRSYSSAVSPDTAPDLLHKQDLVACILGNEKTLNSNGEQLTLKPMTSKEKDLLKRILTRKLVPEKFKEARFAPSTLYGAVHLARTLVKIPELLASAEYGETKINLLIDYLNNFMKFLEDHPEWFSDTAYTERST